MLKNIFSARLVVVFVVLLLLTAGLRLYKLGEVSFVADEFLDMNSSYGYAQTGNWQAWDFNYGVPATMNINDARDERAIIYKWQVAELLKRAEPTEEHARLVSVLWGVFSFFVITFATWFFTGSRRAALIAGFLFAVSVSALTFDRRLRMYAMFYPLYLLTSVFFFATLERAYSGRLAAVQKFQNITGYHLGYGVLTVFFFTISLLTHQLTGTLVFTFLSYCILRAVLLYRQDKKRWNIYTQSLAVMIIGFLLLLLAVPQFVQSFSAGLNWFDNHYSYWNHFWNDFEHPLLALLVVVGGVFYLSRNARTREGQFLFLSAFVPLVLAIWFWQRNVGPQYIFMAQSFLLILVASAVHFHALFVPTILKNTLVQKFGYSAVVAIGLILLPQWSYFFGDETTYHQPVDATNAHYRKLFTTFNKEYKEGEVLVTRNFRNYYFSGKKVPVYDFGGELAEEKLQKSELDDLRAKYSGGWIVLSKNDFDYISNEAETYLESDAFEKVKGATIRGGNAVYRW